MVNEMGWRHFVSLLVVCSVSQGVWSQDEFVVTQTEYGPVQGTVISGIFNGEYTSEVVSYYAVPFGEAERFSLPQKVSQTWTEPRAKLWSDSKACPQHGGVFDDTHPGWRDFSEDCLFVNIFTPHNSANPGPYPVMVWFYGGAFTSGGNIMYPGHFLATRDVIVVVVNYRVRHMGFAFTNSSACPGNFGLWDQNLALQFVRDNIGNFNGDTTRVTMFGQSAGAASASLQMVSPQTQGLAQQAIMESGTESNFWSLNWPEASPENFIWEVASKVNCSEDRTDHEMIDCLRALTWQEVNDASFRCTEGHFCQGMAPVVDGPGGFLPDKPQNLPAMVGPIITGHTRDDGSMYTVGMIPEALFGGFNRTMFLKYLRERLVSIWEPQMEAKNDTDTTEEVFHNVDFNYAPWPYVEDRYQNREAFNRMITDAAFGFPWDRQLKNRYETSPSYGYVYDYRGRNATDYFAEWMGVPHQGELPQVWGWTLLPLNEQVRVDSGIFYDAVNWTDEDRTQTVFWQTLYSNFASTGNPTPTPVSSPVDGSPITWTAFDYDDMSYIYVNNVTVEVRDHYRQKDYAFWREHIAWMTEGYAFPIATKEEEVVLKKMAASEELKSLKSTWMEDAENELSFLRALDKLI